MKIQQIEIRNFQSHENTVINLSDGINIFMGTSNHGKTSIIRALMWIFTNRPMGTAFISYWNKDDEDIKEITSAKIILSDNNTIERRRSSDFNGYVINNKIELEALKGDVPDEISKLLNLSDYNIQSQFDPPFLISSSSGEVARFFNQAIKIDDIDKMLAAVEQKKRRTKTDIAYLEKAIKQTEEDLKSLSWVDLVEADILSAETLSESIERDRNKLGGVSSLYDDYKKRISLYQGIDFNRLKKDFEYADIIIQENEDNSNRVEQIKLLVDECLEKEKFIKAIPDDLSQLFIKASDFISKSGKNKSVYDCLKSLLNQYKKLKTESEAWKDTEGLPDLFSDCSRYYSRLEKRKEDKTILSGLVDKYRVLETELEEIKADIEDIKKEMPDVCPLCGNELKGEI
jgi:exonuclease SbcC